MAITYAKDIPDFGREVKKYSDGSSGSSGFNIIAAGVVNDIWVGGPAQPGGFDITFDDPLEDANYIVFASIISSDTYSGDFCLWAQNLTINGFHVLVRIMGASSKTVNVAYIVVKL